MLVRSLLCGETEGAKERRYALLVDYIFIPVYGAVSRRVYILAFEIIEKTFLIALKISA